MNHLNGKPLWALVFFFLAFAFASASYAQPALYTADWKSLDSRPTPQWWKDAKLGIFIHWGLYSVPSWGSKGSYAEWYLKGLQTKGSAREQWHREMYGPDFTYRDFASLFKARNFDPDQWADLFARAGARYVVLTSKHHDGFCLWPNPESNHYNSMETGCERDLVGELAAAIRKTPLRFGLYFSLYEWDNPLYPDQFQRYRDQYLHPQFKDLVNRYQPAVIFADGEWDKNSREWGSEDLLAWLYNESPAPDEVVVNDRWGGDTRFKHGGYYSTEYDAAGSDRARQYLERGWEECRGLGRSFGYNRNEDIADYLTKDSLIQLLVQIVSRGGNLLLNVGPTHDGKIPVIMQERLLQLGRWLDINGSAIYGTRTWRTFGTDGIHFTQDPESGDVFAFVLERPGLSTNLADIQAIPGSDVYLLGVESPVSWQNTATGMSVQLDAETVASITGSGAWAFRIIPKPWVETVGIQAPDVVIDQTARVVLKSNHPQDLIHFTLDGSEPTTNSLRYDQPLELTESSLIRTRAFRSDHCPSLVTEQSVRIVDSQKHGIHFSYYEGQWSEIPDFAKLQPLKTGTVHGFDPNPIAQRQDNYGIRFETKFEMPFAGQCHFRLGSDDGSKLMVNGEVVANNDGFHSLQEVNGTVYLEAGSHQLIVDFFEGGGDAVLEVFGEAVDPGRHSQIILDFQRIDAD